MSQDQQNPQSPAAELAPEIQEVAEKAVKAITERPELTSSELLQSYVWFNNKTFFERPLTAMSFGMMVLTQLKIAGLGVEQPDSTKILGYVFGGALTPVEINIYGYLCYKPNASVREVAKKRKLGPRQVVNTIARLVELGLVKEGEDGTRTTATLEDLTEGEEPSGAPQGGST